MCQILDTKEGYRSQTRRWERRKAKGERRPTVIQLLQTRSAIFRHVLIYDLHMPVINWLSSLHIVWSRFRDFELYCILPCSVADSPGSCI